MKIELVTWNILAQRYIHNDLVFEWSDRLSIILRNIEGLNPDVLCLQEVELSTAVDDFGSLFDLYNYSIHQINKKRNSPIGNMTLWKKDTFKLEGETPLYNSSGVHTILEHIMSSRKVWISNIHLRAGLRTKEKERVNQLKSTFKLIKDDIPCCIVGDFNDDLDQERKRLFDPQSNLHKLIIDNGLVCNISPDTCYVAATGGVPSFDNEEWSGSFFRFDHIVTSQSICLLYTSPSPRDRS